MFIKTEKKRNGLHVTAWVCNYSYSESCSHVYLKKETLKNGNKSTVNAYCRAANIANIPVIFSAKTYFWNPASNSNGRRRNEERRQAELDSIVVDNYSEKLAEIKAYSEQFLKDFKGASINIKGASINIDDMGVYLFYKHEKYHLDDSIMNAVTIESAFEGIKTRRVNAIRLYLKNKAEKIKKADEERSFIERTAQVFVYKENSIQAGNCKSGTENFINSLSLSKKGFHIRAIKGNALLNIKDDSYTRRAIRDAINNKAE